MIGHVIFAHVDKTPTFYVQADTLIHSRFSSLRYQFIELDMRADCL